MPDTDRIVPILVYENIPEAHDFLVNAFDFSPGGIAHDPDGNPVHGEVRVGDRVIWLHRADASLGLVSPRTTTVAVSGLVIFVADVDAHFRKARAAGARLESEPQDMPYGQREYGARDVEGHRWWFATSLRREP
jgi:MerR family transcriptional regulator, thiopeptide resistance regulator